MVITRNERHQAIRQILSAQVVGSQHEIVRALRDAGFECDQSSVSRDLRELAVIKEGGRYVLPAARVARELAVARVQSAGPNLLILHTEVGAANLVAVQIDQLDLPEVLGTIAGDDTIFLATPSSAAQNSVRRALGFAS